MAFRPASAISIMYGVHIQTSTISTAQSFSLGSVSQCGVGNPRPASPWFKMPLCALKIRFQNRPITAGDSIIGNQEHGQDQGLAAKTSLCMASARQEAEHELERHRAEHEAARGA